MSCDQSVIPKIHQELRSDMTLSLHSSLILEPSPQGLISSSFKYEFHAYTEKDHLY